MNNCVEITLDEVLSFLKEHDNYTILTHASPDGDTIGSGYALCSVLRMMGKKANVKNPDEIPDKFSYFKDEIEHIDFEEQTIISVDIADEALLGRLKDEYSGRIQLAIDHHVSNTHFAERLYLDVSASAVCECIFDVVKGLGYSITVNIANALYTGIATDSGCFKYSNTTPKTHIIAAELVSLGIDFALINRLMFDTKSKSQLEIEKMAMASAEFAFDDRCIILTATKQMIEESGCSEQDMEGLAPIARCVEGVLVAVVIKEKEEGTFKVSLRTYPPVDASEICKNFGGGGHKAAAGCTLKGEVEDVKSAVKSVIGKALEQV